MQEKEPANVFEHAENETEHQGVRLEGHKQPLEEETRQIITFLQEELASRPANDRERQVRWQQLTNNNRQAADQLAELRHTKLTFLGNKEVRTRTTFREEMDNYLDFWDKSQEYHSKVINSMKPEQLISYLQDKRDSLDVKNPEQVKASMYLYMEASKTLNREGLKQEIVTIAHDLKTIVDQIPQDKLLESNLGTYGENPIPNYSASENIGGLALADPERAEKLAIDLSKHYDPHIQKINDNAKVDPFFDYRQKKEEFERNTKSCLAIAYALRGNLRKAEELIQQVPPTKLYSKGKLEKTERERAMLVLTYAYCNRDQKERVEPFIDQVIASRERKPNGEEEYPLSKKEALKLTEYYPQKMLESIRVWKTNSYSHKLPRELMADIINKSGLSYRQRKDFIYDLDSASRGDWRAVLLRDKHTLSPSILSHENIVKYFHELPQKERESFFKSGITHLSPSDNKADSQTVENGFKGLRLATEVFHEHPKLDEYYEWATETIEHASHCGNKREIRDTLSNLNVVLSSWHSNKSKSDHYQKIRELSSSLIRQQDDPVVRKLAANNLLTLAQKGEAKVPFLLTEVLRDTTRKRDKQIEQSALVFEQQAALRVLLKLNNADSNAAMFSLVISSDVDSRVKKTIVKNLLKKKYFPETVNDGLKATMQIDSHDINWRDLEFLTAVQNIPSADLREKAINYTGYTMKMLAENGESAQAVAERAPDIPQDSFMQWCNFAGGDKALLGKVSKMYKENVRKTELREALLFGITNVLETEDETIDALADKLKEIDLQTEQDTRSLARVLKLSWFNEEAERLIEQVNEDYYNDNDYE